MAIRPACVERPGWRPRVDGYRRFRLAGQPVRQRERCGAERCLNIVGRLRGHGTLRCRQPSCKGARAMVGWHAVRVPRAWGAGALAATLALLGGCVAVPVEPYEPGAAVAYPGYETTVVTPGYYSAPAPYYYGAPPVSLGVWGWSGGSRHWHDRPPRRHDWGRPPPPHHDWGRPPPPRPHWGGRPDGPRPDVRPPPRPPHGQWQRPSPPRPRAPLINPEGMGG